MKQIESFIGMMRYFGVNTLILQGGWWVIDNFEGQHCYERVNFDN